MATTQLDLFTDPVPPAAEDDAPAAARWPVLTPELIAGIGSPRAKLLANLEALETARRLVEASRAATADEAACLLRFTGWGGLPWAFEAPDRLDGERAELATRVRAALDEAAFAAARASALNGHYTPPWLAAALWTAAERAGFTGGRVLEPAAGSGYFLATMPEHLRRGSEVTAIECDTTAALVLRALFEPHGVRCLEARLEHAPVADDGFDLVIGNVPFGNYPSREARPVPYRNFLIHDYFLARALALVRPGGLVVALTSIGTLDKRDPTVREHLAARARLIAAWRLPQGVAATVAGTQTHMDVVVLRRLVPGEKTEPPGWIETMPLDPDHPAASLPDEDETCAARVDGPLYLNRYFAQVPGAVLGTLTIGANNAYRDGLVCVGSAASARARLEAAVAQLEAPPLPERAAPSEAGADIPQAAARRPTARARAVAAVYEAARALVAAQADPGQPDAAVEALRRRLNEVYDACVRRFGFLHAPANRRAAAPEARPLLLSLEVWDPETGTAEKAAIFRERTVQPPQPVERAGSLDEALAVTLAETGGVDLGRIGALVGLDPEEAARRLAEAGRIFHDPATGRWETADAYLSGDVRAKLEAARAAGPEYAANVRALEAVAPRPVAPEDIALEPGVPWIGADDIAAFIRDVLDIRVEVGHDPTHGFWTFGYWYGGNRMALTQAYGTEDADAMKLLLATLNQRAVVVHREDENGRRRVDIAATVAAREKQRALIERFREWVLEDEARARRIAEAYNRRFNARVPRRFDGSHLTLPGFSGVYTLRRHQRDAVWRIIASGTNTLLDHVVGAGKTLVMVCAGMELRRLGVVRKPCYVVPNNILEQFTAEFLRAYPGARVLMAEKDALRGDRRRAFLARIATEDWDAIVITHSAFERIRLSPAAVERELAVLRAEIDACITAARGDAPYMGHRRDLVKELERQRERWNALFEKALASYKKDEHLYFDELGIDMLFVDEAHLFKNMARFSRLGRLPGLPNTQSQRAFDLWVKTRYIMRLHGGQRGIVFATATCVSNSIAELWTMQRFLQPETLRELGIGAFDAWAHAFARQTTALEVAPDGSGFRLQTRFARFVNVPELLAIFSEVADSVSLEEAGLPVPEVERETVVAEPSEVLLDYVAKLVERAERIRNREVAPDEDNMLAVTTDGRKAALDMRLVDPDAPADPRGKLALCAERVAAIWRETAPERGAQLVFCDLGTPKGDGAYSVYEDLRERLVALGVPAEEIAFIHDAGTDAQKEAMMRDVRAGRVRVLIGSTGKMGCGMNVQRRLAALHHLDAPWRPADVEQREGRIVRQGNGFARVRILRYVTEGSFDAYVWQLLETKARFIAQIGRVEGAPRSVEDVEQRALTYGEVKALASGNPLVLEKAEVEAELGQLRLLAGEWARQRSRNRLERAALPDRIAALERQIAACQADLARLATAGTGRPGPAPAEAAAIAWARLRGQAGEVRFPCGPCALVVRRATRDTRHLTAALCGEGVVPLGESPTRKGLAALLAADPHAAYTERVRQLEAALAQCRARLDELDAALAEPDPYAERRGALERRLAEIEARIYADLEDDSRPGAAVA